MRTLGILLAALLVVGGWTALGQAAVDYRLFEYALNVDSTVTNPPGSQLSFNSTTGLGSLSFSVAGTGAHYLALYVDHDIDEFINTFFNEAGAASGSPAAGLSWEIDIPVFPGTGTDIYSHFSAKQLDKMAFDGRADVFDDVAMALGWDFSLADGETATITFSLSTTAPAGGFYLSQLDPDSQAAIYFTTGLSIQGGGIPGVPEPATLLLLGSGLAGLALLRKRG